jgi:hypothetical protein
MNRPYDTGRFANVDNLDQVESNADLAQVVERMHTDLLAHPDEWKNSTLDRFLEALAASLGATPLTSPTWKAFAEAVVTASGYE